MGSSAATLDGIEAQRSAGVSHDQQKRRYFTMNVINNCLSTLCSRGDGARTPPTEDTESAPELFTNLRLSDLYDPPGEYVPMNPDIFSAMRGGNIEFLEKMKRNETPMACFKNNKGESVLHLASAYGHLELVKGIVSECPSLLLELNWEDRLPLHVAARAGHSSVVKTLVASVTYFSAKLLEGDRKGLDLYVLKDKDGDTALHLALKDLHEKTEHRTRNYRYTSTSISAKHRTNIRLMSLSDASTRLMETAACLVNANQRVSFLANKEGISPMYLAVEAGNVSLVNAMLNHPGNNTRGKTSDLASQLKGKKSLVHAALKAKNIDVLTVILNKDPSFVNERDEEGRTCLSVGSSIGFYEGVCNLLDRSTSNVFECDTDGSFPIHMAVEKGHVDVVKELLKRFPDSIEQLNKQGQNILHIAAKKSGKARIFLLDYIEKLETKNHLMEEQDVDGNTPLHLATINWRPKTAFALADYGSTRTNVLNIQNAGGLRALDIAETELQSEYVFRERMTLMVLLNVYQPERIAWLPTSGMTLRSRKEKLSVGNKYKDRVDILMVVAALVATMTFAAGFTMPGGFNSSTPNSGMAILVNDKALLSFLQFDSLAMYSSVLTIVALIWAQLGDQELAHRAFNVALPSLFFALFNMSSAFFWGLRATIKQNSVLSNAMLSIYLIYSFVIIYVLVPYVIPQISGIPIIQDLTSQYLLVLSRLVNEDDD